MKSHARSSLLFVASLGSLSLSCHSQTPLAAQMGPQLRGTAPVMVPDARVMDLDDLGLYQLSSIRRGEKEQFFPFGWMGNFDEDTGVSSLPSEEQNGKRSWLLHPPWKGGTSGIARQNFTFALPNVKSITLNGAFAMRVNNTDQSDGVTFRVKVDGKNLLEENTKATQWREFSFDLTRYAGRTVTIAFESDSGPKNNSGFDFAVWGGRQLVLDGFNPPTPSYAAPVALPLAKLASGSNTNTTGAAPAGAYRGEVTTEVNGNKANLKYTGADGSFEYSWQTPQYANDSPLGILNLTAAMKTSDGAMAPATQISLGNDARIQWIDGISLKWQNSRLEKSEGGATLVSQYTGNGQSATVRVAAKLVGKSLVLDVTCDKPLVRWFTNGSWGPVMRRRAIATPYYTSGGTVYFLQKENLFVNTFDDWTASNASYMDNGRTIYNALTDGSYKPLRERAVFAPAWHVDEVFPTIPNPVSPFLNEVGGKLVLDVWGGNFMENAQKLEQLHDYGLRDIIAIIHVWQRDGYDNGLPAHYPANAKMGGDEGMKQLVQTATRLGYRIALHENYVDYYPNYEGFKDSDISLKSDGTKVLAWLNTATKIQSFAVQPNAILPLARSQSPEIHRRYGTNGNYLDVHTAVAPWFHVDARASEKGAGLFSNVFQIHKDLFTFERDTHNGPVFGEGNNHWFWSGTIDGAEAQVTGGWNTPLLVNFDLLKIHPLQSNHGMGYYERWWDEARWSGLPPMQVLDRYRAQTLAFGHAGFLGGPTWNDVRLAWQEHNLVTPVTARYATAIPNVISYQADGKWMDDSALARSNATSSLLRISYDNGLTLLVNNSASRVRSGLITLPAYGWQAEGAGVTAYTSERNGIVADFAQTPTTTYANARNSSTWNLGSSAQTRVSVANFEQTAPRRFRLTYKWAVGDSYDADNTIFVHFSQPTKQDASAIVFQNDHVPPTPTTQWKTGTVIDDGPREITIPDNVQDGDYQIGAGLFNAQGRRKLANDTDEQGRARLGTIQVRNNGQQIAFVPPVDRSQERAKLYEASLNAQNTVVDFGSVRTNGTVSVRREGNEWVLQTLPRDAKFEVQLDSTRFGRPTSVKLVGTAAATVGIDGGDGKMWRLPLSGAREYRWRAG